MREQQKYLDITQTARTRRRPDDMYLHIRRSRYDDADYEAAVAIENAIYPEHPQHPDSWRYWDSNRDAKYLWRRYLGEVNGKVVVSAEIGHTHWSYQPGKFFVYVAVEPDYQHRGIGSAVYNYLMDEVALLEPTKLVSRAREDHGASVKFLENRGFQPVLRAPTSRLALADWNPAPFRAKVARVLQSGIAIKTLAQLQNEDPDWKRKVYDLEWECLQDVPTSDPLTRRSMRQFENVTLNNPRLLPDAWFIATDGDHYVGLSVLWRNLVDQRLLNTGLTGVVRSHRRRGIATALKVHAIEFARRAGAEDIDTDNEENNPMFQLNLQLGFQPQPAFVDYAKELMPPV